jgi:flagellar hook-associated protein 1 FlgK
MQALTTDSAVDTNQAVFLRENQEHFIGLLLTRREAITGVWQDEEFADMIRQQHAYNASAKMITIFNEIYETLINRLGLY